MYDEGECQCNIGAYNCHGCKPYKKFQGKVVDFMIYV